LIVPLGVTSPPQARALPAAPVSMIAVRIVRVRARGNGFRMAGLLSMIRA
jgi:hypothetical protein